MSDAASSTAATPDHSADPDLPRDRGETTAAPIDAGQALQACPAALASSVEIALSAAGLSERVSIPVSGAEQLIVRVSPVGPHGRDVCWQLHDVRADEALWVPAAESADDYGLYCQGCEHRVSLGRGYGLFVLPNNGQAMGEVDEISFQVSAWECQTRLPAWVVAETDLTLSLPESVIVETDTRINPPEDSTLALGLHLLVSKQLQVGEESGVDLETVLSSAGAVLDTAGIELSLEATADIDTTGLSFLPSSHTEIDQLMPTDLAEMNIPVLVVPCLTEINTVIGSSTPLSGYTTRIPGGYPACGLADAVILAANCTNNPPSSAALGVVLAHELGHFLGLYHVTESTGAPDHIADTEPGNLMDLDPLSLEQWPLTPGQISVIRTHPYLRVP